VDNNFFNNYLEERYKNQIDWYDKKSIFNQKIFKTMQWSIIILAAIAPILILVGDGLLKWIAAGIALLIAIGTSAQKVFKYQENWINYRTTCETLKKEGYYYNSGIYEYKEAKNPEELFVERVENLISRENTYWMTKSQKKNNI